jgi:hypothetical protein
MNVVSFAIGIAADETIGEEQSNQCRVLARQCISQILLHLDQFSLESENQSKLPLRVYANEQLLAGRIFIETIRSSVGERAEVFPISNASDDLNFMCEQSNIVFALWRPQDERLKGETAVSSCINARCFSATIAKPGDTQISGPIVVFTIDGLEGAQSALALNDDLFGYLQKSQVVVDFNSDESALAQSLYAQLTWVKTIGRVTSRVVKNKSISLTELFASADSVASASQNKVRNKTSWLIWTSVVIAVVLIFVGNFFPTIPLNYVTPMITILLAFVWVKFRKNEEFEVFRFARAWAESLRIELALSRLGFKKRSFDLLRFRVGPVTTVLRELMRIVRRDGSISEAVIDKTQLLNCGGWLDEQIAYYEATARARKKSFEAREKFRLIGLTATGLALVLVHIVLQLFAHWSLIKLPPILGVFLLTTSVCAFSLAFIFGLFTQQLQLLEQSDSYERMLNILQLCRQALKQHTSAEFSTQKTYDSIDWVFSQALNEQEEWCLRQSGHVV